MLLTILAIIVTFALVIIFHEYGHYRAAVRLGVKVEKFSIGFGPKIVSFIRHGTEFVIAPIPLGGYVKMRGDDPDSMDATDPASFYGRKWWHRILIVLSGPAMNLALGFILFLIVLVVFGSPVVDKSATVGSLLDGYPAQEAGILPGDRIIVIDGKEIQTWKEMIDAIANRKKADIFLLVERKGKQLEFHFRAKYNPQESRYMVGIAQAVTTERIGFFHAIAKAAAMVWWLIVLIFKYLGALITGAAKPEIAGPIGIANMVSQAAHQGPSSFLQFVGLISVNLGILNILPIPVLDGGNMLFFLCEGITKKRLTAKQMQIAQTIGIVILLFIFIFATQQDIFRLIKK